MDILFVWCFFFVIAGTALAGWKWDIEALALGGTTLAFIAAMICLFFTIYLVDADYRSKTATYRTELWKCETAPQAIAVCEKVARDLGPWYYSGFYSEATNYIKRVRFNEAWGTVRLPQPKEIN